MNRISRMLLEAASLACIVTAAVGLIFHFNGNSITFSSQGAQSNQETIFGQQLNAGATEHAKIMWMKSPDWPGYILLFLIVFLVYLIIRATITRMKSAKINKL